MMTDLFGARHNRLICVIPIESQVGEIRLTITSISIDYTEYEAGQRTVPHMASTREVK
jgi:hypothetical protein